MIGVLCEVFTRSTTTFTRLFFFTLSRVSRTICYWFVFALTQTHWIWVWLKKTRHQVHFITIFVCIFRVRLLYRSAITSIIYILNTKHNATNENSHPKLAFKCVHCAVRFLSGISFFSPLLEPTFECQVFFPLEKRKQWKNCTNKIKILAHNHRSPTFNHEALGIKYKCHALHQSSGTVCG